MKRILKWPKHLFNTAAIVVLEVPTMRCRILVAKLGFLAHVLSKNLMICAVGRSCHCVMILICRVWFRNAESWKRSLALALLMILSTGVHVA